MNIPDKGSPMVEVDKQLSELKEEKRLSIRKLR